MSAIFLSSFPMFCSFAFLPLFFAFLANFFSESQAPFQRA